MDVDSRLPTVLVCLDADPQPSVFDSVVAVDAGVDQLLRHGAVGPGDVRNLVYGAMFTRGPEDLKSTAIFIGGSDVTAGESLLNAAVACFFGPMRVSVMLDANGSNTTAAAAVIAAGRHVTLSNVHATVLASTGPVGRRVVQLLAAEGAQVRAASRRIDRAREVCDDVQQMVPDAELTPVETQGDESVREALDGASVVIAAGAPAVELLPETIRQQSSSLQVAIDLSAVSPVGIGGIEIGDKAVQRDGHTCYGAIGVGGTKMKIHKAAVRQLFESNDQVLDAAEIYALGKSLA